ncbi:MAG TPA: glycosyltransferase [Vicinamibacteria bacterium]
MSPLVSVVMPSYNHARYVAEAVRSVLRQDVDGLELVVVDDGSSDDSVEMVRAIGDPRLRLIVQQNQGTHAALNRGLADSRGPVLAILNSDDRYAPGRLRSALRVLRESPDVALVGTWIQVIDAEGRAGGVKEGYDTLDPWPVSDPACTFKADHDLRTALLMQNYWATTSNFVFPRTTWTAFGPFSPLRYVHDWDFALRVQHRNRATLLPEPLLEYRVHPANTIRQNREEMVYEICWLMARHLPSYLSESGFWAPDPARRAEQLLRSVHVYGCDAVLWAMAAQMHLGPPGSAERLLDLEDPARQVYLAEVARSLAAPSVEPGANPGLRARLGALRRRIVGAAGR